MTRPEQQHPHPERPLTVHSSDSGDAVVTTVIGEVDIQTTPGLREAIFASAGGGAGSRLVLDLTRVSFIGSTGLALLVEIVRELSPARSLRLVVNPTSVVFAALEVTGLDRMFTLCETVGVALADDSAAHSPPSAG